MLCSLFDTLHYSQTWSVVISIQPFLACNTIPTYYQYIYTFNLYGWLLNVWYHIHNERINVLPPQYSLPQSQNNHVIESSIIPTQIHQSHPKTLLNIRIKDGLCSHSLQFVYCCVVWHFIICKSLNFFISLLQRNLGIAPPRSPWHTHHSDPITISTLFANPPVWLLLYAPIWLQ